MVELTRAAGAAAAPPQVRRYCLGLHGAARDLQGHLKDAQARAAGQEEWLAGALETQRADLEGLQGRSAFLAEAGRLLRAEIDALRKADFHETKGIRELTRERRELEDNAPNLALPPKRAGESAELKLERKLSVIFEPEKKKNFLEAILAEDEAENRPA